MPGRNWVSQAYRYGYNGKEKDGEFGNQYDYGARIYNPSLSRWLSVDPLAAKYPGISPYVYVANSPLMFIDPDGKQIWAIFQEKGETLLTVPDAVKTMFAQQYGIVLNYDPNTQMLSYGGKSDNIERNDDATKMMVSMLQDNNSEKSKYGLIVMGTGLSPQKFGMNGADGQAERVPAGVFDEEVKGWVNVAYVNTGHFNSDGSLKGFDYKNITPATYGIGTTFEHEYFGHQVYDNENGRPSPFQDGTDFKPGSAEAIVNYFRKQRGLPESYHYGTVGDYKSYKKVFGYNTDSSARKKYLNGVSRGKIIPEYYMQRQPSQ